MSILPHENIDALVPVTALPIHEAASAFKVIQGRTHVGRTVLLDDENTMVNVKETVVPTNGLVNVQHIIKAIADLDIPKDQKNALLDLIAHPPVTVSDVSLVAGVADGAPSSTSQERMSARRRLATMALPVTANADQLDPDEPLVELGLDSLIAIEFKNWLGRTLGVDIRLHDILEADGLRDLAGLVAEKSKFIPDGLAQEALNVKELTTAFHPWIFNTMRILCMGSDEIKRYPGNDYCAAFWKGNTFKLILEQPVVQSFWAEAKERLQELDSQNAASIRSIEAAAFTVSLDEAYPMTAAQRGRQFHFGGEKDAANRWHDKSLQFVVCSNGISGTLGEHTVLDALTLSELNDEIATAIRNHQQTDARDSQPSAMPIVPEPLTLRTDAALEARMGKVRVQFADSIKDSEHAYFLFDGYRSKFLREHKLSPKSMFQMIVQLAAYSTYGYTPPCWETVNQAHYHLGRVDLIQVVNAPVAAFIAAARDPSVSMADRRALLVTSIRAHVSSISKASRNLGWERKFGALRALLRPDKYLPTLFSDPVYKRVRPRVIISNCFETGMLEKGCMWRDTEAVWSHYEVYADNVYFSVVTAETGRATQFCQHLKEAAELVRQIILA
ncbi:Choline/Carnitine o-acyltransferase-domain-containing protein [Xylaria cf. heliscus]|nr:Choline/Carnitine o-acyltransferase-domain-containing protein [Xylaria cf. heliscus]